MKKKLFSILVLSTAMLMTACDTGTSGENSSSTVSTSSESTSSVTPVVGITVTSQGNLTSIEEGQTLQLSAVCTPSEASQNVTWSTSSSTVATVSSTGLVTAVGKGNVVISATSVDYPSIKGNFNLIVTEKQVEVVAPTSISLSAESTTVSAGESLTIQLSVTPENASKDVVWTSSNTDVATVSNGNVRTISEGTSVIRATSRVDDSVYGEISITVETAQAPDPTVDWSTVEYSTHEQYISAEDGTAIKVKGVVTHMTAVKDGSVNYFIQNGTSGYMVYGQNVTFYPVEVGKTYEVGGFKSYYYQGQHQIGDVELFKEIDEDIKVTEADVTLLDLASLDATTPYFGSRVSVEGVVLTEKDDISETKSYSIFAENNGTRFTIRVDKNYVDEDELSEIYAKLNAAPVGATLDIKGVMYAFGYGTPTPQIMLMSAADVTVGPVSDSVFVASAAEVLTLPYTIDAETATYALPTTVEGYDGVNVSWASNSTAVNVDSGAISHGTSDEIVKLTATISYNEASTTRSFYVNVMASNDDYLEAVHTLNFDDALPASQNNNSDTKPGYALGNVTLGSPVAKTWAMNWALITNSENDSYNGAFSARMSTRSEDNPSYIRLIDEVEADVLEFKIGCYNNDSLGQIVRVKYSTDGGDTYNYVEAEEDVVYEVAINSRTLDTIRVSLPEGTNSVSIETYSSFQIRANVDDIVLYNVK